LSTENIKKNKKALFNIEKLRTQKTEDQTEQQTEHNYRTGNEKPKYIN